MSRALCDGNIDARWNDATQPTLTAVRWKVQTSRRSLSASIAVRCSCVLEAWEETGEGRTYDKRLRCARDTLLFSFSEYVVVKR